MKPFGEIVEGYSIPVLNEREIRAAAGILFFFVFLSLMLIIFKQNFLWIKFVITSFLLDFIIRVLIHPRYSPTLLIGRWIVRRQTPEYVGAAQKKFSWIIGIVLSLTMFVLMVVLNTYSIITGLVCLICLIFLFFESSFGICLGCLFYGWFYKDKAMYCPGEVCTVKDRHEIQKISWLQFFIILGFFAFVVAMTQLLSAKLSDKPTDLWKKFSTENPK